MFRSVFRYKGPVWHVLNNVTDVLALSLLWMLCSLPLVTLGAATTALYDSVARCIRYGQEGIYSRFFRTFRNELLPGCLSTLLWAAVGFAAVFILRVLSGLGAEDRGAALAAYAYLFVLVLPVGAACWVFPILSRFSFSFGALNAAAFKFAIGHLPSTAALVFITYGVVYLSVRYILALLVGPAMLMLLWSFFVEPVFRKHGGGLERSVSTEEEAGLDED